ncbi:MAG TPA: Calx-beta domain-containing protein, partial [Chitinophagaceae bacterium]|nr:Calx-beta domain-containing protein [Chitinophagaceae bacterium]
MKRTTYLLGLLMLAVSCDKGGDTPAPQPDPKLRIDDLSLLEGNTANGSFNVTVKLDKPAAKKVTLTYSTVEGTAKAGEDFTAVTAGTASLEPGEKEKTIAIPIVGDEFKEGEDEFTVRIESATGAVLQRQTAT